MIEQDSEKRVALVTGSTSGIGMAIAARLTEDGFRVAFHSKSAVSVGQALARAYPDAAYFQADLSDQAQCRDLIDDVLSHYGRLDVLVNNARVGTTRPHSAPKEATPEIWRDLYDVTVIAPWVLITASEDALRQSASRDRPSCILNISAYAWNRQKGDSMPYTVSKAALNHMTQLLALSLVPYIRVNAISPDLVETPMPQSCTVARQLWESRTPIGWEAQPEEIAQIASMLVASHYRTGEILGVAELMYESMHAPIQLET